MREINVSNFFTEIVGKTRVTSAGESRAGNHIQVRLTIPVLEQARSEYQLRSVSFYVKNFSNTEWKDLSTNRRNEIVATVYHSFNSQSGYSYNYINFVSNINNPELLGLAEKVYERALAVYKKGAFKRIATSHKLNRARKIIKENLLWALREGLSEKEISKLLKEACCADLLSS